MIKSPFIISILFLSSMCFAQEKTSDIQIFTSEFERIEIVRMRSGTDLLEGLNEAVNSRKIKNGVILAGIGAVTDYHYHVVSSKNLPPDEEYPKASVPMDLISVQGYILNGRVHAHIALSDENSVVGGHLEPGTKALTFFIITIGVLPDSLKIENLDNYKF
ncbi:MAG TPA: DNA-binding protein [Candidatus Marinimicrobia bacterium]|nr:DNA-binding protein [Candidatus Neomarinimicrobiota bacterium]HRS52903.1 DNA-binding protein [Candidatus Neomarinimicrobiota bacterium]HRU92947.1 DNA-binding protein [Candidatus Neomarinimicrobiota bacterium]